MPCWQLSSLPAQVCSSVAACVFPRRTDVSGPFVSVRGMNTPADAVTTFNDDDFHTMALQDGRST